MVLISISLHLHNLSLQGSLSTYYCNTLEEIVKQQNHSLVSAIDERFTNVKTTARLIGDTAQIDGRTNAYELLPLLRDVVLESGFRMLAYADLEGNAVASDGRMLDLQDVDYVGRALAGETNVSDPFTAPFGDVQAVAFSTPVVANGHIAGALIGVYDTSNLGALITASFDETGYVYVCNARGDIIATSNTIDAPVSGSLADVMAETEVVDHDSKETILENMGKNLGGHSIYTLDNSKRLMHYQPIGINDWYIISIVRDEVIASETNVIVRSMMTLAFFIVTLFVTLFAVYAFNSWRHERALYRAAYVDELTGLPNLAKLKLDAEKILKERPEQQFMIMKFDIYQFKMINEMFGFGAGDQIIRMIADVTQSVLDESYSVLARVNADCFILFDNYHSIEDMEQRRTAAIAAFRKAAARIVDYKIDFRFGRYIIQPGETDVTAILEKVNLAHRVAKEERHTELYEYDEALKNRLVAETELEGRMEQALENNEFIVYLQPKYQLDTERVVGAEALVRWLHNGKFIAYPGEFIPLFEKNGFVTRLDMYMLEKVCGIIKGWIDSGEQPVTVSVNFSRLHLRNEHFVTEVDEVVSRFDIPKKYIEIELTESTMFDNEDLLHSVLSKLHDTGYTLSMDDFGTGYSSLGLLKNLPVDVIKVDRAFFNQNKYRTRAKIVIESVMQMAKRLGIHTVAEGVETQEHIDFLKSVGCDVVQGYYYAKPVEAAQFKTTDSHYPKATSKPTYRVDFSEIGDVEAGRGDMGSSMPVYVHRLSWIALRKVLTDMYGEGEMIEAFKMAGRMVGAAFVREKLDARASMDAFFAQLAEQYAAARMGFLHLENLNQETGRCVLALSNHLECSGIADQSECLCQFDEGFMEGALHEYTGKSYSAMKIGCGETDSVLDSNVDADVCRLEVKPK